MAELLIRLSDGRTLRRALSGGEQTIGRDATCDIQIDDQSTSRRHARFYPTSEGFAVEDLGSKNGTLVNESPCTKRLLKDGDEVLIGSVAVRFCDAGQSNPASVVIEDDAPTAHGTKYASSNKRLLLSQRRLEMIYELSERLTTLQSVERLVEDALAICFETLQFERGAVGIRRLQQRQLDWPVVRNLRGAGGELTISRTLLNRALEHGERATFTDAAPNVDPTVSIVQHGIRSAMCVPLTHKDQILGVIYGDRLSSSTPYTQEDVDFLAGIAQLTCIGLVNSRLLDEQRQMERIRHDIELARNIQNGFLPGDLPNREGVRVAALNEPGQRVSGDYYDVIERPDGRLWCIIADVTGEGVSAALLMANLQAAVRVTIEETDDPGRVLARWNSLICKNTGPSKFITCLCVLLDPASRDIRYASAGHFPPVVLYADGTMEELPMEDGGFPLGVMPDVPFSTHTAVARASPFLLFGYTDGVIEAMNAQEQPFGRERLLAVLGEHRELQCGGLIKQTKKAVAQFVAGADASDDLTMIAARIG